MSNTEELDRIANESSEDLVTKAGISNYYGGVVFWEHTDGKYYWGFSDYCYGAEVHEISLSLYYALAEHVIKTKGEE